MSPKFYRRIAEIVVVAIVYFALARLGQLLAIPPGNVTPVWLPSGVMLAWALVRGGHIWPGVFLGAFVGNIWAYFDPSTTSLILKSIFSGSANGLGDVISTVGAAWVINRVAGVSNPFGKIANVSWFLLFGVVLGSLASALFGVTALALVGFLQWEDYIYTLTTWWTGDAIGVAVFTPFLVVAVIPDGGRLSWNRRLETLINFGLLLAVSLVLVLGTPFDLVQKSSILLLSPILIWAAIRLKQWYAFLIIIMVASTAVIATAFIRGPFTTGDVNMTLIYIQLFIGIVSGTILFLKVGDVERKQSNLKLQESEKSYRILYEDAPAMLHSINASGYVVDVSHFWLESLGYERDEVVGKKSIDFLTEESRRYAIEEALPAFMKSGTANDIHYQFVKKNGELMDVLLSAIVIRDEKGEIERSVAVSIDITERNRVDLQLQESEQRFRDFAETSADWLWETDADHRFSFISDGFVHATSGLQAESILGMKRTDFAKGDMQLNPEKWKKHLAELDAHRPIKDFQYSVISPQGGVREFSVNGKPNFDADGTFMGYRGVASDLTHLKKNQAELNVARKRAETILEMAPFAIVTIDQQLNIISFNGAAEETFGYARDEVLGESLHKLLPGSISERHDELIQKFSAKNLAIHRMNKHGDIKGVRKDGEVFMAEGSVSKQETEDGVVFTAMLTDVTERKRAEEELKHHRDHLEELVAQRTTEVQEKAIQLETALVREKEYNILQKKFVALVSHEFRTPLTIIDGTAQRLIRRKAKLDADEVETRANKIRSAVTRMVGLIDTTLYASQMDAGKIEMKCALGDIGELLLDVCERQAEIAPDHQFNVVVEELPNEMWFDSKLLDQVFTNLLSNAVKYAPLAPRIEVKGWQENEVAIITVTDHGAGIPEEDLPLMFGRFFRASNVEGIKGTGLGLSVCKEFIEMHGGTIGVASVEGEGSTFTVRIPIIQQGHKDFGSGI